MKVYVAGSWYSRDEIKKHMIKLQEHGYDVYDWTVNEADFYETDKLTKIAEEDRDNLMDSDVVIADMSKDGYDKMRGTYTEVGMAVGAGKLVILILPSYRYIFKYLTNVVKVNNIEEAIGIVDEYYDAVIGGHTNDNVIIRGRVWTEEEYDDMVKDQEDYADSFAEKHDRCG